VLIPANPKTRSLALRNYGFANLRDELTDAGKAGLGTGLVAKLGLDLVTDLRELLVAAELAASDGGHDLFVGHGEQSLAPLPSLRRNMLSPMAAQISSDSGRQLELLTDTPSLRAR
jgi:hypothetical protein